MDIIYILGSSLLLATYLPQSFSLSLNNVQYLVTVESGIELNVE